MFSVIIPLYNKENYIERTINSVLNQSYSEFEILIINDGSSDNSERVVEAYKDGRIRLINKPNGGESSARNLGIKMAKYNFMAFLDADDTWQPEFLTEMRKLILNYDKAGIYTSNYLIKTTKGKFKIALKGNFFKSNSLIEDYFKTSRNLPLVTSNTAVIHKNIFKKLGYFNEDLKIGPDLDMWYRIAKKFKIAYSSYLGAIYYQDAENRVCNQNRKFAQNFFESIRKNYSYKGITPKITETRYINELIIKEALEILKKNNSKTSRNVIVKCHKMGLPFISWRLYYIATYFPNFVFKIMHRLNIYILTIFENITYKFIK